MTAILDFTNMAAPRAPVLEPVKKSKKYGMGYIWAKFGAFGKIWIKETTRKRMGLRSQRETLTLMQTLVNLLRLRPEIHVPDMPFSLILEVRRSVGLALLTTRLEWQLRWGEKTTVTLHIYLLYTVFITPFFFSLFPFFFFFFVWNGRCNYTLCTLMRYSHVSMPPAARGCLVKMWIRYY